MKFYENYDCKKMFFQRRTQTNPRTPFMSISDKKELWNDWTSRSPWALQYRKKGRHHHIL